LSAAEDSVDPGTVMYDWLASLEEECASRPEIIVGPFGTHGVLYEEDDDGESYALVGFALPDGVFAEIEYGTYGCLAGWRVYLEQEGSEGSE